MRNLRDRLSLVELSGRRSDTMIECSFERGDCQALKSYLLERKDRRTEVIANESVAESELMVRI
jgi:hypothetical protein